MDNLLSKDSVKKVKVSLENFNNSLQVPLPEDQFMNSTIKSISKELTKRGLVNE